MVLCLCLCFLWNCILAVQLRYSLQSGVPDEDKHRAEHDRKNRCYPRLGFGPLSGLKSAGHRLEEHGIPSEAPTVKSKKDMKNFSANKEDMPPQARRFLDGALVWGVDACSNELHMRPQMLSSTFAKERARVDGWVKSRRSRLFQDAG